MNTYIISFKWGKEVYEPHAEVVDKLEIVEINEEDGIYKVKSKDREYTTKIRFDPLKQEYLAMCECKDFEYRKRPCKHIVKVLYASKVEGMLAIPNYVLSETSAEGDLQFDEEEIDLASLLEEEEEVEEEVEEERRGEERKEKEKEEKKRGEVKQVESTKKVEKVEKKVKDRAEKRGKRIAESIQSVVVEQLDKLDEEMILRLDVDWSAVDEYPLVYTYTDNEGRERSHLSFAGWIMAARLQGDIEIEAPKFEKLPDGTVIATAYAIDKKKNIKMPGQTTKYYGNRFIYEVLSAKAIRNALRRVIDPEIVQQVLQYAKQRGAIREATTP